MKNVIISYRYFMRFILVGGLFTFSEVDAQNQKQFFYYDKINFNQIKEFIELYVGGQHEIIAHKFLDNDFSLTKHVPNYSLGNKDYIGHYTFEKSVIFNTQNEFVTDNTWTFKTIKYADIATEYQIEFDITSHDSFLTFRSLTQDLINNSQFDIFKTMCNPLDSCIKIGKVIEAYCVTDPNYNPEFELSPFTFDSWTNSISIQPHDKSKEVKNYPVGENKEYFILDLVLGKEYPIVKNARTIRGTLYIRKLHNKISNIDEYKNLYDSRIQYQKIDLKRRGNIYLIPIQIGDKSFDYIIDSGASDMVISKSIELYLRNIGVLRDSDYLEAQVYQLADGSTKKYKRAKLPSIKLGSTVIQHVIVSIATEDEAPLLLGKSFLDKFSSWKIDNQGGFLEYIIR